MNVIALANAIITIAIITIVVTIDTEGRLAFGKLNLKKFQT